MLELCCLLLNIAQAEENPTNQTQKNQTNKQKKKWGFWEEFLKDFFLIIFTSTSYVSMRSMFQLLQRRIGLILLLTIKTQSFRWKCEDIAKKNIDIQKFL